MEYCKQDNWTLYHGDCLEVMKTLEDESIDLIFTSPPYNLGNSSGGSFNAKSIGAVDLKDGYEEHTDDLPHEAYVKWQKEVLTECWRLLPETGAIFYNHKPRVQNGTLQLPLELNPGLNVRQIVTWYKKSGINYSPTFYLPVSEWIIIFAKPKFRLKNKQISIVGDVWEIPPETKNPHPAPFPVALPKRAIETINCETVMDPFSGSGSTGVACIEAGKKYIVIDNSTKYLDISKTRLEQATLMPGFDSLKKANPKKKQSKGFFR